MIDIHFYDFQILLHIHPAKMAANLLVTRLQQSLSSTAGTPTDVKFLFKEKSETGTIVKEIRAHKLILALVSDAMCSRQASMEALQTTIALKSQMHPERHL